MQLLYYDYTVPEVMKSQLGDDYVLNPSNVIGLNYTYTSTEDRAVNLKNFLSDYGVDISVDIDDGINSNTGPNSFGSYSYFSNADGVSNEVLNLHSKINSQNSDVTIIGCKGFDLYDMNGELAYKDYEGHAMTITGYTEKGEPIVSTWGEQYVLSINGEYRPDSENAYVTYSNFTF